MDPADVYELLNRGNLFIPRRKPQEIYIKSYNGIHKIK